MAVPIYVLGEKRAEVKAANPDDKIGDIAKKMGKMWQELDEKAKVGHFFPFMCKPCTAAGSL